MSEALNIPLELIFYQHLSPTASPLFTSISSSQIEHRTASGKLSFLHRAHLVCQRPACLAVLYHHVFQSRCMLYKFGEGCSSPGSAVLFILSESDLTGGTLKQRMIPMTRHDTGKPRDQMVSLLPILPTIKNIYCPSVCQSNSWLITQQ